MVLTWASGKKDGYISGGSLDTQAVPVTLHCVHPFVQGSNNEVSCLKHISEQGSTHEGRM